MPSLFLVFDNQLEEEFGRKSTLYNVCAVPWGVLSTVGVFSTVGGYHEYHGGIS